ncbi:MAG: PQQ-binding-like beta-propeller repeat protein [Bauldia sp.]|nr:PQQ-binding-like beta-propeller repeat protein [Bauldia sp.]MCW5718185.1 PQQ-binding-like beta-propeller repeat protein [Bauldia sp.]
MRVTAGLLLASASLVASATFAAAQTDPFANFTPVTDAMLADPPAGDWLMWRGTQNHWGYSPLDQITTDNVGDLRIVWSRAMTEGHQEATPLVHDGIMYIPHPRDIIQALDATTGDLLWEYRRELPAEGLPSIILTRNVAIWEDRIIFNSKDNFLVALDARTGELVWETEVRGQEDWGWSTSGPMIANGMAISGRSCAQQTGTGGADTCFLTAHDLATGEEMWRFYTLPQPGEPGYETWAGIPDDARRHVGSWITPSFDPELNLVYFGTSVTSPYSKFYKVDAANLDDEFLYQTSTLAIDATTGDLVWYQQHIRDQWDLDHPFERILVDTVIAPNPDEVRWISPNVVAGEERRVLTGIPGKTGIFYSIDRATGEFLWARETVYQNVISDIDTATGRATHPVEMIPTAIGQSLQVCPPAVGGKDWPAGAYSPLTNTIYYPLHNLCMNSITLETDIRLSPYVLAPGATNAGTIRGINVETGEQTWIWENATPQMSLLTTGGGLLFGGDVNRRFRAFDQETGDVLWEQIMPAQVGGFPVSYEVDGRQYIAVPVGSFLLSGAYTGLNPDQRPGTGGNAIIVFALPEN